MKPSDEQIIICLSVFLFFYQNNRFCLLKNTITIQNSVFFFSWNIWWYAAQIKINLVKKLNHNSVVMTVLSCGILLFSFSFLVEMASEDTSHGEILSRSEALRTLSRSEAFLALLIRFWLLTLELELPLEVGKGNFDLLLLVTEDSDLVTGWFEAKDVSWNRKLSFKGWYF